MSLRKSLFQFPDTLLATDTLIFPKIKKPNHHFPKNKLSSNVRTQKNITQKYYGEEIANPVYKVDSLLYHYKDLLLNRRKINLTIQEDKQLPLLSIHSTIGSNNTTIHCNDQNANSNWRRVMKVNNNEIISKNDKALRNKKVKANVKVKPRYMLNLKSMDFVYPLPLIAKYSRIKTKKKRNKKEMKSLKQELITLSC